EHLDVPTRSDDGVVVERTGHGPQPTLVSDVIGVEEGDLVTLRSVDPDVAGVPCTLLVWRRYHLEPRQAGGEAVEPVPNRFGRREAVVDDDHFARFRARRALQSAQLLQKHADTRTTWDHDADHHRPLEFAYGHSPCPQATRTDQML